MEIPRHRDEILAIRARERQAHEEYRRAWNSLVHLIRDYYHLTQEEAEEQAHQRYAETQRTIAEYIHEKAKTGFPSEKEDDIHE
jgi:hypothetical protein